MMRQKQEFLITFFCGVFQESDYKDFLATDICYHSNIRYITEPITQIHYVHRFKVFRHNVTFVRTVNPI